MYILGWPFYFSSTPDANYVGAQAFGKSTRVSNPSTKYAVSLQMSGDLSVMFFKVGLPYNSTQMTRADR